ncbi:hypothetical protein C8R47DRAFT_1077389 [Mycena vitilis]|nr:hypothetical protein C8R47DRAFT_1077389 [Mycena vitilis]
MAGGSRHLKDPEVADTEQDAWYDFEDRTHPILEAGQIVKIAAAVSIKYMGQIVELQQILTHDPHICTRASYLHVILTRAMPAVTALALHCFTVWARFSSLLRVIQGKVLISCKTLIYVPECSLRRALEASGRMRNKKMGTASWFKLYGEPSRAHESLHLNRGANPLVHDSRLRLGFTRVMYILQRGTLGEFRALDFPLRRTAQYEDSLRAGEMLKKGDGGGPSRTRPMTARTAVEAHHIRYRESGAGSCGVWNGCPTDLRLAWDWYIQLHCAGNRVLRDIPDESGGVVLTREVF